MSPIADAPIPAVDHPDTPVAAAAAASPRAVVPVQPDVEEARRAKVPQPAGEIGGRAGPEPTRFGDWEANGRCTDF